MKTARTCTAVSALGTLYSYIGQAMRGTVTEPEYGQLILGQETEDSATSSGLTAARMEPSFKGGLSSGSATEEAA